MSDKPIPGLNLTEAQASDIESRLADSPALGAVSLAALQSLTGVSADASASGSVTDASASASTSARIPPASPGLPSSDPTRPDVAAAMASSTATVASQAAGFERVADISAAAPAVMGKSETVEQLQAEVNALLTEGAAGADAVEMAALLDDVAASISDDSAAVATDPLSLLAPGELIEPVTDPLGSSPLSIDPLADVAFNRLMNGIQSFEARIEELTGLVYSAFEGVGPELSNAKNAFGSIPTNDLLAGLGDSLGVVNQAVSEGFQRQSAESSAMGVVSSSTDAIMDALNQTFGSITSSLSDVLNTVSGLTGSDPGAISGLLGGNTGDLGGLVSLVGVTTGTVGGAISGATNQLTDLLDQLGGGSSGGSGNPVTDLLDQLGGSGSGNPVTDLLDQLGGGGSGNPVTDLLDQLGGGSSGGSGNPVTDILDQLGGGGSGNQSSTFTPTTNPIESVIDNLAGGVLGGGADTGLLGATQGLLNTVQSVLDPDGDNGLSNLIPSESQLPDPAAALDDALLTGDSGTSALSSSAGQSLIDLQNQNPLI